MKYACGVFNVIDKSYVTKGIIQLQLTLVSLYQ